jgi:hypothetical protein
MRGDNIYPLFCWLKQCYYLIKLQLIKIMALSHKQLQSKKAKRNLKRKSVKKTFPSQKQDAIAKHWTHGLIDNSRRFCSYSIGGNGNSNHS